MQVLIALLRDGFHRDSAGGRVRLARDGTPLLDYALTPYLFDGARRAMIAMAELQFAAGATSVMPVHDEGDGYASLGAARAAISAFDLRPRATTVVSAHVMLPAALRSSALTLCVLALLSPAVMAATDKTSAGAPAADGLAGAEHSATLKRVRDTATITIGVREASVPFSFIDSQKQPQGYSVDLCLKVADAIKNELKLARLDVRFMRLGF